MTTAATRPKIQRRITLHREQRNFAVSKATFRGCHAGIGGGKSFVLAIDLFARARAGCSYGLIAPTYRQLTRSTLRSVFAANKIIRRIRKFHKADMILELGNGAEVFLCSAEDPDSLRGPNWSGAAMDEASLMEEMAYDITMGRLREGDSMGWLSAAFTPKGRTHWTYQRFGTPQPDTETFRWRTRDNPFLPRDYVATLEKQYAGAWAAQELGGQFVQIDGAEFLPQWFGPDIWFEQWPHPSEILLTVLSLDPSKGKDARVGNSGKLGDYSAYVLLKLHKDGTIYVDADLDQRRVTTQIVSDGIALYELHRPDAFAVEINQFQELLAKDFIREARERKLVLPVWGWDNRVNKEVRIRRLAPMLAGIDGRFKFKANSKGANLLVAQLQDFRAPPHPDGYHDDGPDGLEQGVRQLLWLMQGGAADQPGGPRAIGA